jgi:chromosome segregation ATPase
MLKSLEITGFKSFGKKAVISIDTPITSVVGPNGSGKSNVVEAIRFVLGEQSMKSLRGKGQSDLLFKGSKGVPAANKLKVAITFDNSKRLLNLANDSGKNLSLDFDSIVVKDWLKLREELKDLRAKVEVQNTSDNSQKTCTACGGVMKTIFYCKSCDYEN